MCEGHGLMLLNNKQTIFVIWNAILNQSQNSEKTLNNTYNILNKLKDKDISEIFHSDIHAIVASKPSLHRFPNKMSNYLYDSLQLILLEFNGQASSVFTDINSREKIISNLMRFNGIGKHKAVVAYSVVHSYVKKTSCSYDYGMDYCRKLETTIQVEIGLLTQLER